MNQDYGRIAGIDVHKKWLYVTVEGERRRTGSTPLNCARCAPGNSGTSPTFHLNP